MVRCKMLHVDFHCIHIQKGVLVDTVACIMETNRKCICCKDIFSIVDKLDELDEPGHVHVG